MLKLSSFGLILLGFSLNSGINIILFTKWSLDPKKLSHMETPNPGLEHVQGNDHARNDEGWREIHIFQGPTRDLKFIGKAVGFSQVNQDIAVLKLLNQKKKGFFVDLAANHAVVLSNSYRLEADHDWNGICIEPNSAYQWGHMQRKCTIVQAIIGANRMEKVSVVLPTDVKGPEGPGGGIVDDRFDNKKSTVGKVTEMYTVSLTEILDRFHAPAVIDYLSLDVEGAELYVMETFAFDRYKIRVLTVERPNQELVNLFYQHGYVYVAAFHEFGDETLFVLKSELPMLNLTVVETDLHKGSHELMEVLKDPFQTAPRVLLRKPKENQTASSESG